MTNQYKKALDAVTAIDIFKNTTDHNLKTLGEYIWPHQETIRRALRIAHEFTKNPSKETVYAVQNRLEAKNPEFKVCLLTIAYVWDAMRDQMLKEVLND